VSSQSDVTTLASAELAEPNLRRKVGVTFMRNAIESAGLQNGFHMVAKILMNHFLHSTVQRSVQRRVNDSWNIELRRPSGSECTLPAANDACSLICTKPAKVTPLRQRVARKNTDTTKRLHS